MIPVDQTVIHSESTKGNCFAACIASLLELPCDDVPNFAALEDWLPQCSRWLENRGLGILYVAINSADLAWHLRDCYVIAGGRSPRGSFGHCVVARLDRGDWKMVHDPHPSRAGIVGDPDDFAFLVKLCGTVYQPGEPGIPVSSQPDTTADSTGAKS